jgi:hypothetical protein
MAVCVAFVVLALHASLIGPLLLGLGSPRATPSHRGSGATVQSDALGEVMTLVLLDSSESATATAEISTLQSHGLTERDLAIRVTGKDPWPTGEVSFNVETAATLETDPVEIAARAALFARYTGQIKARIERAWLRPRTAIGLPVFDCQVQITQDAGGLVTEVMLETCDGSLAWQNSIVQAIQSASPLPAPPHPDVYSEAVTLTFTSHAFDPAGSAEGFEPPMQASVTTRLLAPTQPELESVSNP